MNIEPSPQGFIRPYLTVTFDSFDERFLFGMCAPQFSKERWHRISYLTGMVPFVKPYSESEADYPQSVEIPRSVVMRAIGETVGWAGGQYAQAARAILNAAALYLNEQSATPTEQAPIQEPSVRPNKRLLDW